MAKKSSKKSRGKVSSGKSGAKTKSKPAQRQIKFPTEKKSSRHPVARSPKPSTKSSKPSKPSRPRQRSYKRTYIFKEFKKKFGKTADKKYWKKVERWWVTEYDKKKRSAKDVQSGINRKFVRTLKNRFEKTKREYTGVTAWRKDKETQKWKKGKPVKRFFWRDKLTGELLRSSRVGARMRKVVEPDLIRGYMKKHGIKKYSTARKRYLKETKNMSLRTIFWLYGESP